MKIRAWCSRFTEAQQGIAFDDMMKLQQKVADVVRFDPSVMNTMSSHRAADQSGTHLLSAEGQERPRQSHERDRGDPGTAAEDVADSRVNVFLQIPPTIRIGG